MTLDGEINRFCILVFLARFEFFNTLILIEKKFETNIQQLRVSVQNRDQLGAKAHPSL